MQLSLYYILKQTCSQCGTLRAQHVYFTQLTIQSKNQYSRVVPAILLKASLLLYIKLWPTISKSLITSDTHQSCMPVLAHSPSSVLCDPIISSSLCLLADFNCWALSHSSSSFALAKSPLALHNTYNALYGHSLQCTCLQWASEQSQWPKLSSVKSYHWGKTKIHT